MTDKHPEQIFHLQTQLVKQESAIATVQGSIKAYEAYVEVAIACDDTLKNDQQRKAKKLEMEAGSEELRAWRRELGELQHQRGLKQAELEYARNLFACWKLAERRAIAEMEAATV